MGSPPSAAYKGVRMSTVCIVDTDRIWFKARLGLPRVRQVARDPDLAASVILDGKPSLATNGADPDLRQSRRRCLSILKAASRNG